MKTNSKKKIVVSTLAIAMGAALVGSISGSVAWYQYSTRVSAAIAGTSAGTSRNLQIAQAVESGTPDWKQHLDLGTVKFRPASILANSDGKTVSKFLDHPVYKTAQLPDAATGADANGAVAYAEYNFVFRCTDTTASGAAQVAKDVYLTELNIVNTAGEGGKDVTPTVRIAIDGTNDFIVAPTAGPTSTQSKLDLNKNTVDDKDGWDVLDQNGNDVTYTNGAASYTSVAPGSVKVGSTNPYSFTDKDGRALTTTKTGSDSSEVVKIQIWLEGWQPLNSKTIWDTEYINQNFAIQMQFACEADR